LILTFGRQISQSATAAGTQLLLCFSLFHRGLNWCAQLRYARCVHLVMPARPKSPGIAERGLSCWPAGSLAADDRKSCDGADLCAMKGLLVCLYASAAMYVRTLLLGHAVRPNFRHMLWSYDCMCFLISVVPAELVACSVPALMLAVS
jgi:hypothetical protein